LHARWRRDCHDQIHPLLGAGFEQQRNVQNAETRADSAGTRQEGALGLAHQRVHDGFQTAQLRPVGEHQMAQYISIESMRADRGGKGRSQGRDCAAVRRLKSTDHRIGVENRDTRAAIKAGGGGFAHGDAAG